MTTEPLLTFKVTLFISATCKDDAKELIEDYTGTQTNVEILRIHQYVEDD